jgi:hypothetical protein
LRGLAPRTSFWRDAQFDTIRLCLIKVAGRVTEMITRIKIALPTAYPYQIGFATLAGQIAKAATISTRGSVPQIKPFGETSNPGNPRHWRHDKRRHDIALRPRASPHHE